MLRRELSRVKFECKRLAATQMRELFKCFVDVFCLYSNKNYLKRNVGAKGLEVYFIGRSANAGSSSTSSIT